MQHMPETPVLEPVYSIEDPKRVSQTDLTSCHLAIQVGDTHFSYAILDPGTNAFIALRAYYLDTVNEHTSQLESLEAYLHQEPILYTAFREIRVSFDSPRFCLVPKKVFEPECKREYLSMLFAEQYGQVYLENSSGLNPFHLLYAVDKNLIGYLRKEFGTDLIFHTQYVFLDCIVRHPAVQAGKTVMFIRLLSGYFTLTLFKDRKLQVSQSHCILKESDVAYHALLAWKQLAASSDNLELFLSGDMDESSPVIAELGRYFREIGWLERPSGFQYIDEFNQYRPYMFYSITSLLSCES